MVCEPAVSADAFDAPRTKAADAGENSSVSTSIHLPPPTFSDEGQTLPIMDMEKLKKMQQSVRIGELNLGGPGLEASASLGN
jgi:hypothetical protein